MRHRIFLLVLLVFFVSAQYADAVPETIYWNDSDLINFPAIAPEGGSANDDEDTGSPVTTQDDSEATTTPEDQTPLSPPPPSTPASEAVEAALGSEAVVTVVVQNPAGTSAQNAQTETGGQDLLTVLSSGGAIEVTSAGGGGGSANGRISENTAGIRIVGTKVRSSLRTSGVFLRMLADIGGFGGQAQTRADVGLVAASTALTNSNIEEVFFKLHEFTISYRSRGYLLGFVPVSFTVKVTVNPELQSADRVRVTLPWYRFFLRKLFSTDTLTRDIGGVVASHIQNPDRDPEASADQAKLFVAVADFLKSKIDVVEESVGQTL